MMRWGMTKALWERCRFTNITLNANLADGHAAATGVFSNVGTTVPETVMRHVYGLIGSNRAATFNNVHIFHVPEGATGTQWYTRFYHVTRGGDNAYGEQANFVIPANPDPLKPLFVLEGGSKLYASAATASFYLTVMYWDDILTGVEDT
jgi:hypothetical protein